MILGVVFVTSLWMFLIHLSCSCPIHLILWQSSFHIYQRISYFSYTQHDSLSSFSGLRQCLPFLLFSLPSSSFSSHLSSSSRSNHSSNSSPHSPSPSSLFQFITSISSFFSCFPFSILFLSLSLSLHFHLSSSSLLPPSSFSPPFLSLPPTFSHLRYFSFSSRILCSLSSPGPNCSLYDTRSCVCRLPVLFSWATRL